MYKELISAITRSLDGKGIPYMFIGGQALLVHGEPRLTRDIDVTLGIGSDGMDPALQAVEELGLEAPPEDLVIHKLFAHRPRDLEDAKGVILKNPGLDRDYIRGWLEEFDTSLPGAGLLALFDSF